MKNRLKAVGEFFLTSPAQVLKGLALILFLFAACSVDAQTQQPSPSGAKPAPAVTQSQGFQVVSCSLPESTWGYLIRTGEKVVFMSHDRSKAGWQDVPTYATEAEAIAAGNAKAEELSSGKPKSNPQPIPTKK